MLCESCIWKHYVETLIMWKQIARGWKLIPWFLLLLYRLKCAQKSGENFYLLRANGLRTHQGVHQVFLYWFIFLLIWWMSSKKLCIHCLYFLGVKLQENSNHVSRILFYFDLCDINFYETKFWSNISGYQKMEKEVSYFDSYFLLNGKTFLTKNYFS